LAAIKTEGDQSEILISSITAWEIALLVTGRRVGLSVNVDVWFANVERSPGVKFIPIDNEIAMQAVTLPGDFHKDPADRIIVATARKFGAAIVTADEKILSYPHVRTIWQFYKSPSSRRMALLRLALTM
jgi:PIN domain nuclease of toxin-antitoxin system